MGPFWSIAWWWFFMSYHILWHQVWGGPEWWQRHGTNWEKALLPVPREADPSLIPSTTREVKGQELQRQPSPGYRHESLEPQNLLSGVRTTTLSLLLSKTEWELADISNSYSCASIQDLLRIWKLWKLWMLPLKKQTHDRHVKLQATVDGSEIILDPRESKPALEVEWTTSACTGRAVCMLPEFSS